MWGYLLVCRFCGVCGDGDEEVWVRCNVGACSGEFRLGGFSTIMKREDGVRCGGGSGGATQARGQGQGQGA